MSKKYLIKFKPVDLFFFGKENRYRRRKDGEFEADYYQESAYFPQQTTILGVLRYLILQENGQIPIGNEQLAKELIGDKSFEISDRSLNFGKIKSLSPVFIAKGKEYYIPNPKDFILKDGIIMLTPDRKEVNTNLPNNLLTFKDYVEKDGIAEVIINTGDITNCYKYSKDDVYNNSKDYLYEKVEKIGITKNKLKSEGGQYKIDNKAKDDKAFYKQIFLTFKDKDTSFAVIAELEDGHKIPDKTIVPMGAEKSLFEVSVEDFTEDNFDKLIQWKDYQTEFDKLFLLSDTYIDNIEKNDFLFAISDTNAFRFIKTEVKEKGKYGKFTRSKERYNLIKRGSIFYFTDKNRANDFGNKIKSQKAGNFDKIGYNKYIIIDKNN